MASNESFREFLQDELIKRAKKNSRFSVRAFARQLNIEASSLAQILGGKRNLTDKMCARIGEQLNLNPNKIRSLMKSSVPFRGDFAGFKRMEEDAFRVIADWYYYAILELIRTDSFKGDLKWIARTLGISTAETHSAVERLKRLKYLEIDSAGNWHDRLGSAHNLGNEKTAPAYREHQKQILKKAVSALDDIAYEERVQSSMMLVGDRKRIAEAKRRILNFIEELDEYMKSGETHDEVFALSVSLFPVSKTKTHPNERTSS